MRQDILKMEGYKAAQHHQHTLKGLECIEACFPNNIFPLGGLHEFLAFHNEQLAATVGFTCGLFSLLKPDAVIIWISTSRKVFPSSLSSFNINPSNILFVKVDNEKQVLWATEEALQCQAVSFVITEIPELTFMQSRRLQLVVERSNVTGFIFRTNSKRLCTTASTARWEINTLSSITTDELPGVGFPRWKVSLLKVRNGKTGSWNVHWQAGNFMVESPAVEQQLLLTQKAG